MVTENLDRIGSEISLPQLAEDSQAQHEEKSFGAGDKRRQEESKQLFHFVFCCFLTVAAIIFIVMFSIRMLHFIFPDDWCWLKADRLQAIDKSLFSGVIGGALTTYLKQIIPSGK